MITRLGLIRCNCGRLKPLDLHWCEDCGARENKAVIQIGKPDVIPTEVSITPSVITAKAA